MRCLPFGLLSALWLGSRLVAQVPPEQSPVPRLCELLSSADPAVRRVAAAELAGARVYDIGLPSRAAVAHLLRVFESDEDPAVVAMAAEALAANAPWPLGAIDHVASRLDDWSKHGADADAIERIRVALRQPERRWLGTALVPHLMRIAKTPACSRGALGALAVRGADAAAAAPELLALLATMDRKDRWRAAFALACIGGSTTAELVRHSSAEDPDLRLWATRARCRSEPPSAELAALVSPWLKDNPWAVATAVQFGPAFAREVEKVVAMVRESTTRHAAYRVLRALGPHAAPAVPALLELLASSPEPDFDGTFVLLGVIGSGAAAATDALLAFALAAPPADPLEAQRVESKAQAAVAALAKIAPERAVAALWPGVAEEPADPFPGSWHRVHRFACLGPAAASAVPQLHDLLKSGNRLASARALLVLERVGAAAAPVANDLVPWLRSDDSYMRWLALATVGSIGPAAAPLLPELTPLFDTTSNHDTLAMQKVVRLGPTAEPLLLRALRTGDSRTRAIVAEQLVREAWISADALAAVITCLDDPDPNLVGRVFTALVLNGSLEATARAQARRLLTTTNDRYLRGACVDLLWRSMMRQVPPDPLHGWSDYHYLGSLLAAWEIKERPASAMAVFADAESFATWARSLLPAEDASVRTRVAAVLGRLASSEANLRALETLAGDADALVRWAAVQSIGWHGKAAVGSAAMLAGAMRDKDWFVRATAVTSLRAVLHAEPTSRR